MVSQDHQVPVRPTLAEPFRHPVGEVHHTIGPDDLLLAKKYQRSLVTLRQAGRAPAVELAVCLGNAHEARIRVAFHRLKGLPDHQVQDIGI